MPVVPFTVDAPEKTLHSSWRKQAVSGAVALTAQRLVVSAGCGKHIDVTEVMEFARLQWVPLTRVPDLVAEGEIWSSASLIALMHVPLSRPPG